MLCEIDMDIFDTAQTILKQAHCELLHSMLCQYKLVCNNHTLCLPQIYNAVFTIIVNKSDKVSTTKHGSTPQIPANVRLNPLDRRCRPAFQTLWIRQPHTLAYETYFTCLNSLLLECYSSNLSSSVFG